ncbi:proteasome regulatory particle subunit [Dimargaris cristalligena]|uniref:PCI domain-containing protein n=1 Tax=Dimargaris cristalligena TaxID=215637 RepID=A0A4V1J5H8_9FUNG|nr:proteasome regulatory particle subunit [Dimargaris cristalligena]RKP39109.1 PCI domain-containing protein [Dimargaris cristalligena]|eukprot:RKP39109.1 PCI domain-containing protein [Dimargaris cristalligena]
MDDERMLKMEHDYKEEVDALLPITENLAQNGRLQDAINQLLGLEKQTRNASDVNSTARLLVAIVRLCFEAKEWKLINDYVTLLSKKHGQLKRAIGAMVEEAMTFLDQTPSLEAKLELIDSLRAVTEGKMFVERERARLTRMLSKIREDEGKIAEAADILQELQVETFGSMDKREKTDFILEQVRLCLAKKDYIRAGIISRKVSTKFFSEPEQQDLKLRYYRLMIEIASHDEDFLAVCKYYREIFDTPSIQADEAQWREILQNVVSYIALAPYNHEQSDLIHRIAIEPQLTKLPLYKQLIKNFTTDELMRWSRIMEVYGTTLSQTTVFQANTDIGKQNWDSLHKRVIEHNLRVIAKYYTRVTSERLTQLLDLPAADVEEHLSKLVVSKTVYAKIDRPAGLVNFVAPQDGNERLDQWSTNVNSLLSLVDKTTHLIAKEEMIHKISKAM